MRTDFATSALRLAGLSGVLFGWSPDAFWRATPAELGALVAVLRGEAQAADGIVLAQLKERFPDG